MYIMYLCTYHRIVTTMDSRLYWSTMMSEASFVVLVVSSHLIDYYVHVTCKIMNAGYCYAPVV